MRAHLISAALGGANTDKNLQITTISVNGKLATPELKVAGLLKNDAETADGKKVVDKSGNPLKKAFLYGVTTEAGAKPASIGVLPPHNIDLTRELRAAEGKLRASFTITAQEKVHLEDGSIVDGKEKVNLSVPVKLPPTFVP